MLSPSSAAASRAAASAEDPVVLVIGASGRTGAQCVRSLLAKGYAVRAGVRSVAKYSNPSESSGTDAKDGGEDAPLSLGDVLREYADSDRLRVVKFDVTENVALLSRTILDEGASYIVCASGFRPSAATVVGAGDTPRAVDNFGTKNAVDAAVSCSVKGFVLVSSLLTNAKSVGQGLNPSYVFLNTFGGVLDEKKEGEDYLRKQGEMRWTVVRPGGLSDKPASAFGAIIEQQEDTLFGLDEDPGRAISRAAVAEVCAKTIDAMRNADASGASFNDRVVEIVQARV